jgi:hypothetical protein
MSHVEQSRVHNLLSVVGPTIITSLGTDTMLTRALDCGSETLLYSLVTLAYAS